MEKKIVLKLLLLKVLREVDLLINLWIILVQVFLKSALISIRRNLLARAAWQNWQCKIEGL